MKTFKQAKKIAVDISFREIAPLLSKKEVSILDGTYIEERLFWVFFPKKDLEFKNAKPTELGGILPSAPTIVVPKNDGKILRGYDLRDDPEKMKEHMDSLVSFYENEI